MMHISPNQVATALIIGCCMLLIANTQAQASDIKTIKAGGISFVYNTKEYSAVKIENFKKDTVLGKSGPADGKGVSPAHYCFNLINKSTIPGLTHVSRYFFPSDTYICAFPLHDASVTDFHKAYLPLNNDARDLRKLLHDHPDNLRHWSKRTKIDIPDFPELDAGNSIVSKFQYLDFQSGSGILFLTQYANEQEPNPPNNEELTVNFQGLTKDGKYYVAARLAITQPSLPSGIDATINMKRDMNWNYLKRAEGELDGLPEESFRPSLKRLKVMLSSIRIK